MFTPIQIILVCVWMWGFTVIGMSVQLFSYGVAVLHGFVTGLIMGDVATGLTVGGTLCLMGLGSAVTADPPFRITRWAPLSAPSSRLRPAAASKRA